VTRARLLTHQDFLVNRWQTGCPVCRRPAARLDARCQVCGVRMHDRCNLRVATPADFAEHTLASVCNGCRS
jgi:hypothetical protein